jgi:probable F420-dependent oxidoreductase
MDIGVYMFPDEHAMRIDELALAAEERGFECLMAPEHTHIPASRRTPAPFGGELPTYYWSSIDPFVGLAMAAAVTTRIKIGTGICLVVERSPIITAKAVASLDFMSGGRFIFGVGGGWNAEAMENHGTRFSDRYEVLRQRVLAMKQIWANEAAEFHGSLVDFDPIWSRPKPVQRPHPPILLAGESAKVRQRVVDYCDGWLPRAKASPDIPAGIADLRARAEASGRDARTINVTVFGAKGDAAVLDSYRAAGVNRVVLGLPAASREIVLPLLDQYARLVSA